MKVALYWNGEETQLVLTPESDFEKAALEKLEQRAGRELVVMRGSFYKCQGGWIRQGDSDYSLMFYVGKAAE